MTPSNQHIPKVLRQTLTKPEDDTELTTTTVLLRLPDIEAILSSLSFYRQRNIRPATVGRIADTMMKGLFAPGDQITFAANHVQEPQLVDGQHRLQAALTAGWENYWTIRALWSEHYSAERVYMQIDTAQNLRNAATIGQAAGFAGLTSRITKSIVAAAFYQNLWSSEYRMPALTRTPPNDDCVNRALLRLPQFQAFDLMLDRPEASTALKKRLCSPMNLAIITETMATSAEEAELFWPAVLKRTGMIPNQLCDRLAESRDRRSKNYYYPRILAQAWNRRYSTDPLRRDFRNTLPVDGTTLTVPV